MDATMPSVANWIRMGIGAHAAQQAGLVTK